MSETSNGETGLDPEFARIKRVNDYRQRFLAGETLSDEELAQAIKDLRSPRAASASAAGKAKARKKKEPVEVDLDALFGPKKEDTDAPSSS